MSRLIKSENIITSMSYIEVDQSGKVEDLRQNTIVAFSNDKFSSVYLDRRIKRDIFFNYRPKVRQIVQKMFAICLFYLLETPRLAKEIAKKGVNARIITLPEHKKHRTTRLKNIQFRYLDIKSEATTTIFKDKVAIHILTQKPMIIVIKNKQIADTYRDHFEILWKVAKKNK